MQIEAPARVFHDQESVKTAFKAGRKHSYAKCYSGTSSADAPDPGQLVDLGCWLLTDDGQVGSGSPKPERLIVNLAKVGYMDSSGLATLVECMRTTKANRTEMILCGMNDRVRAIFDIARLDQFFKIVPTLDDVRSA